MCKKKYQLNKPGLRVCVKCKEEKPLTKDFFYSDKNRAAGLMYKCISCEKARVDNRKNRYIKMRPDQKIAAKARNRVYCQTPKGRAISLFTAYRKHDKKKGRETTVTKADVLQAFQELCTYCGAPATGFDRINNKIGHTKENCVPACIECNVARMDNFTHEEMSIIGDAIRLVRAKREYEEFGNCVL